MKFVTASDIGACSERRSGIVHAHDSKALGAGCPRTIGGVHAHLWRTHFACRVQNRVERSWAADRCRNGFRHGTHEWEILRSLLRANVSKDLCSTATTSTLRQWYANLEGQRSHECERGTQECVRHTIRCLTGSPIGRRAHCSIESV